MSDSAFVHQEAFHLFCGDVIDRGQFRQVYACRALPECVVKVEETSGTFRNVIEWETWQRVKDTPAARWFAPCRSISPSGAVLVMERTRPAWPHQYPTRVPVFLDDLKRTNFGLLVDGGRERLVCHDYGTSLVMQHGLVSGRTKKAAWLEGEL